MVLLPLHSLGGSPVVRITLDGLDQLTDHTRRRLRDELEKSPDHLRLIMTARDDTPDCPDAHVIRVHRIDQRVLNEYLAERGVPEEALARFSTGRRTTGLSPSSWRMRSWSSRFSTWIASRGR